MIKRCLLEITVESAEAAMAAERGGADRIELCRELAAGGLTPSESLLKAVRAKVRLPVFSMVRPRAGNFVYKQAEFDEMERDIGVAKQSGVDGIVLGLLDAKGFVDVGRTTELVELAQPLPVTFHRAFDERVDLRGSLEDVIKTGATRILTSGGKRTALEALELLAELVVRAGDRLMVMPGSGIHAGNIREVVTRTNAREYHAGLSSVVARPTDDLQAFEQSVRQLVAAMASSA